MFYFLQESVISGWIGLFIIDYPDFLCPERVFLLFTANFASRGDKNQF
jgi:hypothetical protein